MPMYVGTYLTREFEMGVCTFMHGEREHGFFIYLSTDSVVNTYVVIVVTIMSHSLVMAAPGRQAAVRWSSWMRAICKLRTQQQQQ